MKRKTTGILISCVVSICCMVVLSMSSHTHDVYASYSRYVTANNVVVRKKASNKGKIVGSYKKVSSTLQLPCPSFLRGGFLFLSFSFIIES